MLTNFLTTSENEQILKECSCNIDTFTSNGPRHWPYITQVNKTSLRLMSPSSSILVTFASVGTFQGKHLNVIYKIIPSLSDCCMSAGYLGDLIKVE